MECRSRYERLPDGTIWRNVTTEAKSKVAETLDDFRGNYLYNLLDENVRRFHSEVPQMWQWDDHEVLNRWAPGKDMSALRAYSEKRIALLVARATRAFPEYAPLRYSAEETERIYPHLPYGPLLDVFVVDMRSYRGPNSANRQPAQSDERKYLGRPQLQWLAQALSGSTAAWKVIAADMPIGLIVEHRPDRYEAPSNGSGPALGRELEIAELLGSIERNKVRNVVWVTADTHYTAPH